MSKVGVESIPRAARANTTMYRKPLLKTPLRLYEGEYWSSGASEERIEELIEERRVFRVRPRVLAPLYTV